jgi:hypothetical protein
MAFRGSLWRRAARFAGRPPEPKVSVGTGAAANTNIAVTDIKVGDYLLSVIEVPASGAMVDRTSTSSITSDGNIQCTAATTGNQVLVFWWAVMPA